ncbi:hypothetical protein B5S30_g2287 [[Candida] boidinii]|nr:hypothetical protein B5S30_g2287 [[Candida] boidinii]
MTTNTPLKKTGISDPVEIKIQNGKMSKAIISELEQENMNEETSTNKNYRANATSPDLAIGNGDEFYKRLMEDNPLDQVSITSAILGCIGGISISFLFRCKTISIPIYAIALVTFHLLEYLVTAKYSADKVSVDSFLIFNGTSYMVAHMVAFIEAILEVYFGFAFKKTSIITLIGFFLTLYGQYLRSIAMITAGKSFSHRIAENKKQNHSLVTDGIYAKFRHPSYRGFYLWALGTQILLCNPISFLGFSVILHKFFSARIRCKYITLFILFSSQVFS